MQEYTRCILLLNIKEYFIRISDKRVFFTHENIFFSALFGMRMYSCRLADQPGLKFESAVHLSSAEEDTPLHSGGMPPSEIRIIPALPLTNNPQSPRSDVSAATELSQDTDKSFDNVIAGKTKISTSTYVCPQVVSL